MALQKLTFDVVAPKIERTHEIEGRIIYAEDYTTKNSLPGVTFQIEGCPYNLRILKGSIKGAGSAATLLNCDVKLTGVMREYEGRQYFDPKDLVVTRRSGIATLAAAKVAYAGSLD